MKHESHERAPGVVRRIRRRTRDRVWLLALALFFIQPVPVRAQETQVPSVGKKGDTGKTVYDQFVVYGESWEKRGDYCVLAGDLKKEFIRTFRLVDKWEHPVIIQLRQSLGGLNSKNPVESRAMAVEGGFRFMLRVELGNSLDLDDVREELLNLLLFEHILKQAGNVEGVRGSLQIPDWIRAGVMGAIKYRAEASRRDSLYRAIFQSGQMLNIDDILRGRPEGGTAVAAALYEASAAGLMTTLLDQRDGIERMKALLRDLLKFDGTDYALLKKHFPDLERSNNSLEKWWALQIASLAEPTMLDILSIGESEAYLQKALMVNLVEVTGGDEKPKKKRHLPLLGFVKKKNENEPADGRGNLEEEYVTYELEDFEHFLKRDDIAQIVTQNEMKLMSLNFRSFPLYRPLIREYQVILETLKKGKSRGVAEKLEELSALRIELLKMARDTEDYLHLYEATTPEERSGVFDDYMKLYEKLRVQKPQRKDAISIYLDKLNKEWDE